MKILIVDDDQLRRSSLSNFLISNNVVSDNNLFNATNIFDASELLSKFQFDVLVLDVVIPLDSNPSSIPDSKNAISFLNSLNKSKSLIKPIKTIGITSYLSDLGRFQNSFRRHCVVIIEANRKTVGWKSVLADSIGYDHEARLQQSVRKSSLHVITVHGIQTFGQWQSRFKKIANLSFPIPFHSYKYGRKSAAALFSKSRHAREVNGLADRLIEIFTANSSSKFIIFSHSFGTYLTVEALRKLFDRDINVPVTTVVLSGSVLENTVDLSFLLKRKIRIVNDCADKDYILWLSEAFVPFLGMAGKTGIFGMENEYLINRYFSGGHSSYFEGDEFMKKYWLPLLNLTDETVYCDVREDSYLEQDVLEKLVSKIGYCKSWVVQTLILCRKFLPE